MVDFNEKLFHRLADYTTVYFDGRVVFTFHKAWKFGWTVQPACVDLYITARII